MQEVIAELLGLLCTYVGQFVHVDSPLKTG